MLRGLLRGTRSEAGIRKCLSPTPRQDTLSKKTNFVSFCTGFIHSSLPASYPVTLVVFVHCHVLVRHWSLYESIYYSPYVAAKLSVWKSTGENKLQVCQYIYLQFQVLNCLNKNEIILNQELLAKMGIPLQQCKQSYSFISPVLRQVDNKFFILRYVIVILIAL